MAFRSQLPSPTDSPIYAERGLKPLRDDSINARLGFFAGLSTSVGEQLPLLDLPWLEPAAQSED